VPVFVAVMVWLIRVLIIGSFSMAGERLFTMDARPARRSYSNASGYSSARPSVAPPRPKPRPASAVSTSQRGEPTYHPLGASARGGDAKRNARF
jgi:hypothetical protein